VEAISVHGPSFSNEQRQRIAKCPIQEPV